MYPSLRINKVPATRNTSCGVSIPLSRAYAVKASCNSPVTLVLSGILTSSGDCFEAGDLPFTGGFAAAGMILFRCASMFMGVHRCAM